MSDTENKDDRLNPLSSDFDPLSALYSSEVCVPNADAPVFDNVAKFELTPTGVSVKETKRKEAPKVEVKTEPIERDLPGTSIPTKLEDGEGLDGGGTWRETATVRGNMMDGWGQRPPLQPGISPPTPPGKKNIRKFMLNVDGPLAKLREVMENRTRIKVTTRSATGIRGHVIAYLAAFDKMWNLALEEVTEVWVRKKKRKSPPLAKTTGSPRYRVLPPPLTITQIGPKTEQCQRYVPKLLMRGEHVAIIQCL